MPSDALCRKRRLISVPRIVMFQDFKSGIIRLSNIAIEYGSQPPFRLLAGTDEFREDVVLQDLKSFPVTEEIGFANREVAGQNLDSRFCPRRRNERSNKGLQISGAKFLGRSPDPAF